MTYLDWDDEPEPTSAAAQDGDDNDICPWCGEPWEACKCDEDDA